MCLKGRRRGQGSTTAQENNQESPLVLAWTGPGPGSEVEVGLETGSASSPPPARGKTRVGNFWRWEKVEFPILGPCTGP